MNKVALFLPKDSQELPDFYNVEIEFHGDRTAKKIEVASHEFVDKIYTPIFEIIEGKRVLKEYKPLGPHHAPYVEIKTTDDQTLVCPINSIKIMTFDKNWSKIVELRKSKKL